jgi:hypothetical protein
MVLPKVDMARILQAVHSSYYNQARVINDIQKAHIDLNITVRIHQASKLESFLNAEGYTFPD